MSGSAVMTSLPVLILCLGLMGLSLSTEAAASTARRWIAYECDFHHICKGLTPCIATNHALSFRQVARPAPEVGRIDFDPARPPGLTEITENGTQRTGFAASKPPREVINWLSLSETGDMRLFTLTDGVARYSIHSAQDAHATYLEGTCKMVTE